MSSGEELLFLEAQPNKPRQHSKRKNQLELLEDDEINTQVLPKKSRKSKLNQNQLKSDTLPAPKSKPKKQRKHSNKNLLISLDEIPPYRECPNIIINE